VRSARGTRRRDTADVIIRVLRLFLLRYLPRRLFAFLTVIELVMLALRLRKAIVPWTTPAPRPVGRSGFDDEVGPAADRRTGRG